MMMVLFVTELASLRDAIGNGNRFVTDRTSLRDVAVHEDVIVFGLPVREALSVG